MDQLILPRLLLIAGTGKNSGKTTLACSIIRKFCKTLPLVAFKISPHRRRLLPGGNVIINENGLYLAEEADTRTGKDSSRMLEAGASRSFFAVADDTDIIKPLETILNLIIPGAFLIGESGALRSWVQPGLFFMLIRQESTNGKQSVPDHKELADACITFDGSSFDLDLNRIYISRQCWKISKDDNIRAGSSNC